MGEENGGCWDIILRLLLLLSVREPELCEGKQHNQKVTLREECRTDCDRVGNKGPL